MILAEKLPFRTWIGVMVFFASAINFSYRSYFPMARLAMKISPNDNDSSEDYGPRYNWTDENDQLLAGFFYGYTISNLFWGRICEYYGPYWSVIVGTIAMIIINCGSVFVVMDNWVPLFISRVVLGLIGGVHFPAIHMLIATWVPPKESGIFGASVLGNVFGSVVIQSIAGVVIERWGWVWTFYLTAFCSVIFLIPWALLISDVPEQNWWCSAEEIDYIKQSQRGAVSMEIGKMKPPYRAMFTSIPFHALNIASFGNMWALYMVLTVIPDFMKHVLHYDIQAVGFLASAPHVSRLIFGFVFGIIGDYLLRNNIIRKVYLRKGAAVLSHIIPGLLLFLFMIVDDPMVCVCIITAVMLFNSALVVSIMLNTQELAPNFAGTQVAFVILFGSTCGFIVPSMVAVITKDQNTMAEWSIIFGISGFICITSGLVFILFGSVDVQPWNSIKEGN